MDEGMPAGAPGGNPKGSVLKMPAMTRPAPQPPKSTGPRSPPGPDAAPA